MEFEEKTVKENVLYRGKIINLRKDEVLLPNGKGAIREVVEHGGGSCILAEREGKFLLVKQFRYPYKEVIWEIPAGKINDGEAPEQTAIRELEEECGYRAERVEKLFDVYPSPAYTGEIIRVFKAEGLKKTATHLDEDEFVSAFWVEKDEIKKMIKNGEIKDGKTLIALLFALNKENETGR